MKHASPGQFRRTLGDDSFEIYPTQWLALDSYDEDAEPCSWPEEIDQRHRAEIGRGPFASDDMEIDDGV